METMETYTCPDCGTAGNPLAKDCCDTCIIVFFLRNPEAPSVDRYAAWGQWIDDGMPYDEEFSQEEKEND